MLSSASGASNAAYGASIAAYRAGCPIRERNPVNS
jgi:hypothetical protein